MLFLFDKDGRGYRDCRDNWDNRDNRDNNEVPADIARVVVYLPAVSVVPVLPAVAIRFLSSSSLLRLGIVCKQPLLSP